MKIYVLGLAKSGEAVIRRYQGNMQISAWDDNQQNINKLRDKYPQVKFEKYDQVNLSEFDYLILSPGIAYKFPQPHPAVLLSEKSGCKVICDIEFFYLQNPSAKYIAVTGTNGKSTVVSLIKHILDRVGTKAELVGNVGQAICDAKEVELYVVEISSYQLDLCHKFRPRVAAITNITPDHIDRHGDFANYIAAKERIFANLAKQDKAVLCIDNEHTRKIAEKLQDKYATLTASAYSQADIIVKDSKLIVGGQEFAINRKNLPGTHNSQNIAVAIACCLAYGAEVAGIVAAIGDFTPLAHRLELVRVIDNIKFVNDSKATNAESSRHALDAYLGHEIYWLLGGVAKEGGIAELSVYFDKIKHAYLYGQAKDEFALQLDGKCEFSTHADLETALKAAYMDARKSDKNNDVVILLSPACASFDQWHNFEERGEGFKAMIGTYTKA